MNTSGLNVKNHQLTIVTNNMLNASSICKQAFSFM